MKSRRGFTLLEMLVATVIMGLAVAGVLSQLSTSMRTAARVIEYDRAALLARQRMDEILLDTRAPRITPFEGAFPETATAGVPAGWRATVTPFEAPPGAGPGTDFLERVELEVWWGPEKQRRTIRLEGFRKSTIPGPAAPRGSGQ